MRVTIEVSPSCVDVSWDGGKHRVSPASLARIRGVGRGALVLTRPHDEQNATLQEAGTVLWSCTLGEATVPFEVGQTVEVEIRSSPGLGAPLADVPWECMLEPGLEEPLAYHPHFAIFRHAGQGPGEEPEGDQASGLRALILAPDTSALRDLPALRSAEEIGALRENLDALVAAGAAEFVDLRPGEATLPRAREELVRKQPHVLHYIGHSSADAGGTSRFLFDGSKDLAPERAFLSLLLDLPSPPHLLVLNSCHSAGPLLSAGLPAKLRRFGIRAVIAMRSSVSDRLAVVFASRLYRKLAEGVSIGVACQAGRLELARAAPAQGHWVLPVLSTSQPAARILHVAAMEGPAAPAIRITFQEAPRIPLKDLQPYSEEEEEVFFGRAEDTRRTLASLLNRGILVLHGEPGVGKTSLIRAGLAPALRRDGFQPLVVSRWPVLAQELLERLGTPGPEELAKERLSGALDAHRGRIALLLDQAEEVLESAEGWDVLLSLFARCGHDTLLLLVVRDNALPTLRKRLSKEVSVPLPELALPPLTRSGARRVLDRLRRHCGLEVDAGLEEIWIAERDEEPDSDREVVLPLFSLVLTRLARSLPPAARLVLGPHLLEGLGGLRGILADWMREAVDALGEKDAEAARLVLLRLVDRATERAVVRSEPELAGSLPRPRLEAVLTGLTQRHLVRALPDGRYVLAHPALAIEIVERCRSTDLAWRGMLRARAAEALGISLDPGWVEPERLDEIDPRGLLDEELAAWLGFSLLRRPEPPSPDVVAGVPDRRLQRAFRLLWKSSSPELLARGLAFAAQMPPHRRGASPLALAATPGHEPEARFAAEAMLHGIARRVAEDQDNDPAKVFLPRLLVKEVLFEGRPLNERWIYPRARDLKFFDSESVLAGVPQPLWPGIFPALPLFGMAAATLAVFLAWLAWPERSLPLAHLPNLLILTLGAVAMGWTCGRMLAIDCVCFPSAGVREELSRVRWRLRNLFEPLQAGAMVPAIALTYGWAAVSLANGLHATLFTPSWLWEPFTDLFFQWQNGALGLTTALWNLAKILLTPVFVMAAWIGYIFLLTGVLAPPMLLLAAGQLVGGRALLQRKRTGLMRCVSALAAVAAFSAVALPFAFRIGADLLPWCEAFLDRPDRYLGPHGLAALTADWRALSASPWTSVFGALAPLLGAALAGTMPDRRKRLAHPFVTLHRFTTTDVERLRPLVAEGNPQAFSLACHLIRSTPKLRGPESLSLLVSLAATESEGLLAAGTPEEREAVAREALAAIRSFDPTAPAVRGQLTEITARLAGAGEDERSALESVREILEDLPPQLPEERRWMRLYLVTVTFLLRGLGWRPTGTELSDGRWIWSAGADERRAALPRAVATVLLLLAVAVSLLHAGLFAGGVLLDLVFPLAEPAGTSFLDPSRTLDLLIRAAELGALGLLGFGAKRLWKLPQGGLPPKEKENGA